MRHDTTNVAWYGIRHPLLQADSHGVPFLLADCLAHFRLHKQLVCTAPRAMNEL